MVKFKDYYQILGVDRSATEDEIKAAYRRLARKYHPDVYTGEDKKKAEEKFKEINEAYEVLSDPEKRRKYDQLGSGWRAGMDFEPPPGVHFEYVDLGDLGFEDFGGFSDFFEMLFGRGARRTGAKSTARTWARKGEDIETDIDLTLEEAYHGGKRRIRLNGKEIEVTIPSGVRDGTKIRLSGQGRPGINGGPPGDLYLKVKILSHPIFQVSGDDLTVEVPVMPWEAVLGAEIEVPTIDGKAKMKIPPGSQSGRKLRLRGKGLPKKGGGRGDQYVKLKVVVPTRVSEREKSLFRELSQMCTENPRRY
ncbi:MAG: DnaJ C-terminal domain-containing protein [Candidatus Syntropharchaeia archaeon]